MGSAQGDHGDDADAGRNRKLVIIGDDVQHLRGDCARIQPRHIGTRLESTPIELMAAQPTQATQLSRTGRRTVIGPKLKRPMTICRKPSLAPKALK
jgi:hypothetical protein